ncbi:FAD-binding oxidoreductase [Niabella hibiscisoli]|nr:FAD-dependent oxidoreductase [Niabella hibiscisoli]MCH5717438.1 FAD-binding oxidoreductase [Niabella hibiscisoli]
MRLRTYESFWLLKNGLLHTYPSIQQNISSDIIVLGGGITGALIADALVKEGYDTVLIDKNDIALGSTSATTSMLQYEIDVPLYRLEKKIGTDAAAQCYKAGIEAIKEIEQLIESEKIDCGFQKRALYTSHIRLQLQKIFIKSLKYANNISWV